MRRPRFVESEHSTESPFESFVDLLVGVLFLFFIIVAILFLNQGTPKTGHLPEEAAEPGESSEGPGDMSCDDGIEIPAGIDPNDVTCVSDGVLAWLEPLVAERLRRELRTEFEEELSQRILAITIELENEYAERLALRGTRSVITLGTRGVSIFPVGGWDLSFSARQALVEAMPEILDLVEENEANRISVVGTTSASPRSPNLALANLEDAEDSNVDLSALRALSVVHALRNLGVPYACMIVEGSVSPSFGLNSREVADQRTAALSVEIAEGGCSHRRLRNALSKWRR